MQTIQTFRAFPDLFNDIAVTLDDVELWLDKVPKIPRTSPRQREYYLKNWDVVEKIKAAMRNGEFETLTAEPECSNARLRAVLRLSA